MSWVTIEYDKCNSCGICLEGCDRCFFMDGGRISVNADINSCSICGRCVSLCPADAITHSEMDMKNFHEIKKRNFISADEFFEFLRQRRSHRSFLDKSIPEPDIKKLVDVVRYSPTGSNSQSVEVLVIQDTAKIKKLSDLAVEFMVNSGIETAKMLENLKAEGKTGPEEIGQMETMIGYGEVMKKKSEMGMDPVLYNAPAVMVFHARDEMFSKKDDCVIASTTVGLLARTMGLEYTYIGILQGAADNYPPVMEELEIPAGNKVYSVIIIGYPELKFLRTVDRRPVSIRRE
ncbi:nitroreductase family protein [Thermodesulfobacteriota bacterium]